MTGACDWAPPALNPLSLGEQGEIIQNGSNDESETDWLRQPGHYRGHLLVSLTLDERPVCQRQLQATQRKTNICSPPLEHHHGVGLQVGQVQLLAFFDYVGMLAHQQPADVGEEEPSRGVVGVGVSLRELVVDAVVPGPLEYVVLMGGGVQSINTHKHCCRPLWRARKRFILSEVYQLPH